MFPILNIGPLAIQAPGLIILAGLYVTFLVIDKQAKYFSITPNDLTNLVFTYLISTIILGRLAYILKFPSIIVENPLSIISINPNFFDFSSGLLLSILVGFIFIQKKKLSIKEIVDALSLPILIFLIFLFLSLLASGNLYGKPTSLPWAIHLWGTSRHPLQLYYIFGLIPIIILTLRDIRKRKQPGLLFVKSMAYLALLIVFLDFFNGDPSNLLGNFNLIQLIALLVFITLILLLNTTFSRSQQEAN